MSSSMKKATKMSVADFERVQSIPDWAVFRFDSYMKYVGHGTLSHSEFLEYHTGWLKLVVKLDTKIFGNRQSRSKSKSHAKNPFTEDEAVNYGAGDCEENEYESEPERPVAPNKLPRNVSVSNRNPVSRLRRRSPSSTVYLKALLTVRLTLPTKKAGLPKKNPATARATRFGAWCRNLIWIHNI